MPTPDQADPWEDLGTKLPDGEPDPGWRWAETPGGMDLTVPLTWTEGRFDVWESKQPFGAIPGFCISDHLKITAWCLGALSDTVGVSCGLEQQ